MMAVEAMVFSEVCSYFVLPLSGRVMTSGLEVQALIRYHAGFYNSG